MDEPLDLRGLKCPLPALMARKALARAAKGAAIIVLADDPLAVVDIRHMCVKEGHAVEAVEQQPGFHRFSLRANSA